TAFNVITGVYLPTNGQIYFEDNLVVEDHPRGKMKKLYTGKNNGKYTTTKRLTPDKITKLGIARTFQNIRLFKSLTVFDNVLIAKHMCMKGNIFSDTFRINRKEEQRMKEEVTELLRIVGLLDNKDDIASSLTYGKQRHLEIARALATEPKLLLLDEPAAGMNPQKTDELMHFVAKIRDDFDLSILMIEHHMQFIMGICENIYVLDYGILIAQGNPEEVQNNPRVIEAYLGKGED
ncbi:MAG: ABC transporter ATP-binding protein, partial [Eubacterium aggregans]